MSCSIAAAAAGVGPNSTITRSIWIQARCERTGKLVGEKENCNGSSTPPPAGWNAPPPPQVKFTPVQLKADGHHQTCVDAMEEFMELIDIVGGETHFRRFRIEARSFEPDEFRNVFQDLMDMIGPSVTFLSLSWWSNTQLSVDDLRKLVFESTPFLETLCIQPCNSDDKFDNWWMTGGQPLFNPIPNLKRIKVIANSLSDHLKCRLSRSIRQLIMRVIMCADNLEYIAIKIRVDREQSFINSILSSLRQLPAAAASPRVSNLKTLKMIVQWPKEVRHLLEMSRYQGLRLETLSISVLCPNTKLGPKTLATRTELTSLFHKFLVTQALTLRKLSLDFLYRRIPVLVSETRGENYGTPFRVPCMGKLHTFKLGLIRSSGMEIDLEFEGQREGNAIGITRETLATTFPNLERLIHRDHQHERKQNGPELKGSTDESSSSAASSSGEEDIQTKTTHDELDPSVFNECKRILRPVRKALKAVDNPDSSLTEKEQVQSTRASLQIIGDHIEECCREYRRQDFAKTWRTNLWTFVSKFTEYDHVKLHRLYKRARNS